MIIWNAYHKIWQRSYISRLLLSTEMVYVFTQLDTLDIDNDFDTIVTHGIHFEYILFKLQS